MGYNKTRRYPRFDVDIEARVLTALGSQRARTRDLSRGGLCFVLPTPLNVGMKFTIEMALVLGQNAFSEPLSVSGKIIWCTPVDGGYQLGAAFASLDAQTKQYLEMFLNFLEKGFQSEEDQQEENGKLNEQNS